MQPVEKKKQRSRKHGWIRIAAAALLLFGASIAVTLIRPGTEKDGGTDPEAAAVVPAAPDAGSGSPQYTEPETEEPRGTLEAREMDELESVTITVRGQEPWTIIRDEAGDMHLKGADGWAVKERLADRVRNALTSLVYEDIITEDPAEYRDRLADFGLDNPFIIAEARFTDGKELTIRLGDKVPIEMDVRYMTMDGDDRLFLVSHSLAEDLDIDREALHPVTQPEIYPVLLDRITVYGQDGKERAEWRLRGAITDPEAGMNWEMTAPQRYIADETIIQNMKTSAGNLRMSVFMDDATEEALARYGLAEPEYTLEMHMAPGSTGTVSELGVYDVVAREGGTVTLGIARSGNELIDYVLFGNEIFKVSHLTLSAFLDADPEDTAARYIAPVPLNSLESMTIEQGGETTVFTREQTGQTDPDTAEEIVICRKDGEEISREAFDAAYERLMTVTVSGRLPEGAQWKTPHTKYTFRAVSGGTHTLELSEWNGLHDAVTLDGETRFYLVQRGAEFTFGTE